MTPRTPTELALTLVIIALALYGLATMLQAVLMLLEMAG